MNKFWNWAKNDAGEGVLELNGPIAEESWWGDEVTPEAFRRELTEQSGPINIWINSPGGDCVAAAQIYNMIKAYKGEVTVQIDGIAASAASVIAMAGDKVRMSPVSTMFIHDPLTMAMGNAQEMEKTIRMLNGFKESIVNAYEAKTGLARTKIADMMTAETLMDATQAKELGFCDEIAVGGWTPANKKSAAFAMRNSMGAILNKMREEEAKTPEGVKAKDLKDRLMRI